MTFFVPIKKLEDWRKYLGDPKQHWRSGRSARSCAETWFSASDFPDPVKKVFKNSGIELLKNLELLIAFPEYQVKLPPKRGYASQNDLWLISKSNTKDELISITVECKVDETFDQVVKDWSKDETSGKKVRLEYLLDKLELNEKDVSSIRYQLLHRTASAIIMAEKFCIKNSMLLVYSFDKENSGFKDYSMLLGLYGAKPEINSVSQAKEKVGGKNLYFGWVNQLY